MSEYFIVLPQLVDSVIVSRPRQDDDESVAKSQHNGAPVAHRAPSPRSNGPVPGSGQRMCHGVVPPPNRASPQGHSEREGAATPNTPQSSERRARLSNLNPQD